MPRRPDTRVLARVEREVTVLLPRSLEAVWASGTATTPDVDRFSYSVLVLLDEHGPQDLTELTGRPGLTKPTASRRVARLGRAGGDRTRRPRAPDVLPAQRVALTGAGDRRVAMVRAGRAERLADVLGEWTADGGATLARLLNRPNSDLDAHRRLPS